MFNATDIQSRGTILPIMADFSTWLQHELDKREWNVMDLSRAAGISDGVLYHLMHRKRNAGVDTCTRIAKALHLPVQTVYEAAGLLPPVPEFDKRIAQIGHLVAQLPTEKQAEVLEFVRLQVRLSERKGRNAGTGRERVRASS